MYIVSLENFFLRAAESVSARNLIKSLGFVKLSISIEFKSFFLSFSDDLFIKSKSCEFSFAVEVNASLNFSF